MCMWGRAHFQPYWHLKHAHLWSLSTSLSWESAGKTPSMQKRNSLREMKTALFVQCHTQLSFLPASLSSSSSDLSQPVHRIRFISQQNRCCWLEVSTQDEGFRLHVFSVWNAAFASTRSGLGGTRQIFLVRPGTPDQTTTTTHARSAVSGHSTVELNPTVGLLLLSYLHKWLKFGWNENAINRFVLMISARGLNGGTL